MVTLRERRYRVDESRATNLERMDNEFERVVPPSGILSTLRVWRAARRDVKNGYTWEAAKKYYELSEAAPLQSLPRLGNRLIGGNKLAKKWLDLWKQARK